MGALDLPPRKKPLAFSTDLVSHLVGNVQNTQQCGAAAKPGLVSQPVVVPALWKLGRVWLNTG